MIIEINGDSIIPVYEQIVNQVQSGVLLDQLATKTPLPSIRQLAADLQLNHNTVAKAYQLLEMNGVIESHGRKGSFISERSKERIQNNNIRTSKINISKLLHLLKESGLEKEEVEKMIVEEIKITF